VTKRNGVAASSPEVRGRLLATVLMIGIRKILIWIKIMQNGP
jgi:hypothetical protein